MVIWLTVTFFFAEANAWQMPGKSPNRTGNIKAMTLGEDDKFLHLSIYFRNLPSPLRELLKLSLKHLL